MRLSKCSMSAADFVLPCCTLAAKSCRNEDALIIVLLHSPWEEVQSELLLTPHLKPSYFTYLTSPTILLHWLF